jgi:hypothetical protein
VSVALPPCATDKLTVDGEIVKPAGGSATVIAIAVDAVRLPEVPVIVIFEVPAVNVQPDVRVSTLLPVVGLVLNVPVKPEGKPDAASVTAPVKPPMSVTAIVSVTLAPGVTVIDADDGVSVKLGGVKEVTVSLMLAEVLSEPDVPTMVTVELPTAAVLLTANVTTLLCVVGLVPNVAVTPLGRPDAERVAGLLKQYSDTVMVSAAVAP